jgi:hypothetical protein
LRFNEKSMAKQVQYLHELLLQWPVDGTWNIAQEQLFYLYINIFLLFTRKAHSSPPTPLSPFVSPRVSPKMTSLQVPSHSRVSAMLCPSPCSLFDR